MESEDDRRQSVDSQSTISGASTVGFTAGTMDLCVFVLTSGE